MSDTRVNIVKKSGKSIRRARIAQRKLERRTRWGLDFFHNITELEYRQWCHPFMRQRELEERV